MNKFTLTEHFEVWDIRLRLLFNSDIIKHGFVEKKISISPNKIVKLTNTATL